MWAEHHDQVQPEWLDSNGHMNLAYYIVVFDRGTDAWLEMAGLGAAFRARTKRTTFAVESHVLYRKEVRLGDALLVRTRVVEGGGKRLHFVHEMTSGGALVAMQEVLSLHVDLNTRRAAPLAEEDAARVTALLPPPGFALPEWVGRRVGQAR
jgi:acyl-CoA thioesterase FadM